MNFDDISHALTQFDHLSLGYFTWLKHETLKIPPTSIDNFSIAKVHMYVDFKNWTKQAMMVFLTQFHYEIWGFTYIIREILGLQPQ